MDMKTRFIGDVHGKWLEYLNIIKNPRYKCSQSIQVGDFGVGFGERKAYAEYVRETMDDNHRFIRGNHDSPRVLDEWQPQWIPDMTVEGNTMFIGGAHSIDAALRIPEVSWWADEELSYEELSNAVELYEKTKPEVMVTHDIPDAVARHLFGFYKDANNPSRTRQAFNTMFFQCDHKPKLWIFGHWHENLDINIFGTRFICLNELSYIDIDLENITGDEKIQSPVLV